MFNLSGSEIVFLLLLALIVLGPEKLPEAVRRFGRVYGELKKMSSGFQSELKTALDEPMREMRETAEAFKKAASFEFTDDYYSDGVGDDDTVATVDSVELEAVTASDGEGAVEPQETPDPVDAVHTVEPDETTPE